jgi:glycosyltransferase involved in cell wall biosynthesis
MKIAIATDWFAPRTGGIESQLVQLAERLGAKGHTVDVLTSTPGAASGSAYRVRPLDVLRLPRVDVAVSPMLIPALARELDRGYDVVHAHVSVVSPVAYAAAFVARSRSMPAVVTFHSVLRYKRHLLRAANAIAPLSRSGVLWSAVSNTVAAQVNGALDVDASVLPNGIDLDYWRAAAVESLGEEEDLVFVTAMRLHPKKRPLALLRAFTRAATASGVRARLIIAGDGPDRAAMERAAQASAATEVRFAGWLGTDELRRLYSRAAAFISATERESFGIAALEARAAGLPVIAMAAAGSADFLANEANALLADDDEHLERQLTRFMRDSGLRRRLATHESRLDRYDWSAIVADHEATYVRAKRAVEPAAVVGASA